MKRTDKVELTRKGTFTNGAIWTWTYGDALIITSADGKLLRKITINDFDSYTVEEYANADALSSVQTEIDDVCMECASEQDSAGLAFRFQGLLYGKSEIRKALRLLKIASIRAFRNSTGNKKEAVRLLLVNQFIKRIAGYTRVYIADCTDDIFNAYIESDSIRNKAESLIMELTA